MDPRKTHDRNYKRRSDWKFPENFHIVLLYLILLTSKSNCQTVLKNESSQIESSTKTDFNLDSNIDSNTCHSCEFSNNKNVDNEEYKKSDTENVNKTQSNGFFEDFVDSISVFTEKYVLTNETTKTLERILENAVDNALSKNKIKILEGVEIKSIDNANQESSSIKEDKGRALFSSYTYEYRLLQKFKNFIDTHIISINLPKAVGIRSFGLKKFFLPLLIGAQVFKSILLVMFLPSILGSFGKILGKGISQLSASSSQASYPPANSDDQTGYDYDNKDFMGYETNQDGTYMYPQDGMNGNMEDSNDANVDMSRFGVGGHKVSYLPSKNSYYKNQMTSNSYKIFQKIPVSSMILSNYDPFYSPLLSRLDGIFARLGLAPAESSEDDSKTQVGGQTLSEVKLEACREQLICLMYASPAKYAPYSNLVSAQLSRELNELRRPVSDNPEILRFFRYMRAARRGQEGTDCMRAHPACAANTAPQHTMIAAYHDINKLVTARKLRT